MAIISLKLSSALRAKIIAEARRRNMNQSELIRVAIETYLEGGGKSKEKISCADLAGDLIGSVKGPSDLSTNEKYMEGFGDE